MLLQNWADWQSEVSWDWQSDLSWDRCSCLMRQDPGKTYDVWRVLKRPGWTVMESEVSLLIEVVVQVLLVSSLHLFPVHWKRATSKNFSWHSCESLLLILAKGETLLSLLGSTTTADTCLLSWLYWTGLLVYLWSVCEWIKLPLPANLWTELLISRQHRWELLQRTFLNRSTSPISFLFHYLWWVMGYKEGYCI